MATFTNQATLSYNGNLTNSNIITGELQEVLSATKNAVIGTYTTNENVTFVVNIINSGTTAFSNLTVTDNLGAYAYNTDTLVPLTYTANSAQLYVNGVLQAAPAVTAGPPLVFSGINIPANSNATLIYEASANQFAPPATDGSVTNLVTITGTDLSSPVTATETITTLDAANLTINKSLTPTTVTENGQLTYTFTIQNLGNTAADAADNVILTDTFTPILNPISVTFNAAAWASPANYTYDTASGAFATVAGQITVPAATYTQDVTTGAWIITPGVSTIVITGTV